MLQSLLLLGSDRGRLPLPSSPENPSGPSHWSGQTLAQILETNPQASGTHHAGPLQRALRSGQAGNLREAWGLLSEAQQRGLRQRWGSSLEEFLSLSDEPDPEFVTPELLNIGDRLVATDRLSEAALIFSAVQAVDGSSAAQAQGRLNAIQGIGAAGPRAEFLLRRLAQEALRPELLLGMGVAGGVFRLTRLAATARLAGSMSSALTLRAAATTTALFAESAAFTATLKLGGAALGVTQDWSSRAWGREWAGGAAMLLGLRAMGGLSSAALGRWAQGSGALEVVSRATLPQLGTLGGIYFANRLEEIAGLRARHDNATEVVDAFTTLLQFHVGGRLFYGLAGPGFQGLEQSLDLQTEAYYQGRSGGAASVSTGWNILRNAASGRVPVSAGGPSIDGLAMMVANGGSNGTSSHVHGADLDHLPTELPADLQAPAATGAGTEAATEVKAESSSTSNAAPVASPPPRPDPRLVRYHFADTEYLNSLQANTSLAQLAGYSTSQHRADLVGTNMRRSLLVPLSGPLEYSPYGAGLVELMRADPSTVHYYTGKWERALVASPGTAILGLGSAPIGAKQVLRAEIAAPIMDGKSKYFLWTAGVSADPLCIRSYLSQEQLRSLEGLEPRLAAEQARIWRAERFAETVRAIAPNYGFINIEDAQGKDLPIIFGLLESLRGDTTIWSDDMQGTGVITAAAMLSWAELTGRLNAQQQMPEIRGIIFGAGAGAIGVYNELVNHGVRPENILVTDSRGTLDEGRRDIEGDPFKMRMRAGIPAGTKIEDFATHADFLINLGVKETFTDNLLWTESLVRGLADKPFFGAMTNPEPGVSPEMLRQARPDAFYGSGNQVYENPVNNFTAFGYIGAGALMARAGGVGPAMTVAAARGIFAVAKLGPPPEWTDRLPAEQREFGKYWLVPRPDDLRLIHHEAAAVARAAAREGLAILLGQDPSPVELARFDAEVEAQAEFRSRSVATMREQLVEEGRRYLSTRYPERYAPFALRSGGEPVYEVAPEINPGHFEYFAQRLGVKRDRWQALFTAEGTLRPTALTEVFEQLRPATEGDDAQAKLAFEELRILNQIAAVSPPLGLALALRRTRVRPENLEQRPTLFHREEILRTVLEWVPEAQASIVRTFPNIPEIR